MSTELRPQQRPDLSHYVGRNVKKVVKLKGGGKWRIRLDGDVIIENKDENLPKPEIEGLTLVRVMLSEMDTRLLFGHPDPESQEVKNQEEVTLNPIKYSITDPQQWGGKEIEPQRLDPEEREFVNHLRRTLPQDPSQERVVDGPEEGEE